MTSAALRFVPVEWRFVILACGAALLVLASGVYTGLQLHAPTITRTQQVVHAPSSGAALAAAWGNGQPVNPSQLGLPSTVTCRFFKTQNAILCYR